MNIYPNQYKHCTKCNTTKSIDNFSKKSANKDGYRNHCKDCIKVYRQNNKERIIEYEKNYRQNNKEYYREYEKNRYKTNSFYNLKKSIRTAIHAGFRYNGFTKKSKSFEILGCSFDEFYIYIENQFLDGMTWDNRGEWHLDHIVPIAFANSEHEIILLNHYSNFRPLWAKDNILKSDTLTEDAINHPLYDSILQLRNINKKSL